MTALTVYGTSSPSTTLTTANTLVTVTGAASTTVNTRCGSGFQTAWGELHSQTFTSNWPVSGSIGAASGHGWLLDATTLEGQNIAAGNWTPTLTIRYFAANGTATADIHVRAFVRSSGGTYTQIGTDMVLSGQSLSNSTVQYAFAATSEAAASFGVGDKLYLDIWLNITANANTISNATMTVSIASSTTQGVANDCQVVTPGYTSGVTTTTYAFTEALTIDDSLTIFTDTALPVDGMSAADQLSAGGVYLTSESLSASDVSGMQTGGVESLTVLDSTIYTDGDVPVEGLSIADTLLGTNPNLWFETLVGSDALLAADTTVPVDALAVSDGLSATAFGGPVDALATADTLAVTDVALPVDALSASDSLLGGEALSSLDALTVSDVPGMQSGGVESLAVSDVPLFTGLDHPVEALVASEVLVALDAFSVPEALATSDALLAAGSSLAQDLLAVGDTPTYTDTELATEALTVTDLLSTSGSATYSFSEALIATDAFLATATGALIEGLSVSDAQGSTGASSASEALIATDAFLAYGGSAPFDTLLLVDALNTGDSVLLSEALTASESAIYTDTELATEPLAIADRFSSVSLSTYTFSEQLVPFDALLASESAVLSEGLVASDGMAASGSQQASDSLALLDSVLASSSLSVFDTLAATDSAQASGGSVFLDALVASDLPSALQMWPIDALTITESASYTDTEMVTEPLSVADLFSGSSTATYAFTEALTVLDGASGADTLLAVDSLAAQDTLAVLFTYIPTPNAGMFKRAGSAKMVARKGSLMLTGRKGTAVLSTRKGNANLNTRKGTVVLTRRKGTITFYARKD